MKIFLAIAMAGITTISNAETLSFPTFRIQVEDGWVHILERESQAHSELGELIVINHPNRNGTLKIQPYSAPDFVSRAKLRNMTNVESSATLTWQKWGDYSTQRISPSRRTI